MKKLVCILLTLVMVMSLSITAFAEENDGYKEVESLEENNTQDITITNTIRTGEGGMTSKKYHVRIDWTVASTGEITIDRSAVYEWDPSSLKYELVSGESYSLNSSSESTETTEVHIEVTNYSNADIGYTITWTTDEDCAQYNGVTEINAESNGVCQANTRIGRADFVYRNELAVSELYSINPTIEGFDGFRGEAQSDRYSGLVTFHPQDNLDELYNKGTITLGKYTVTIGNPPEVGGK